MYLLHNIVVSIKQLSLVTVLKQCCAYPVPSACGTTGDCASLLIATFPKAVVHGSYWLTVIRYFQMDLCYQLIHSGLRRADQKKKKIPFPQDLTQQYAIWRFCSYQLYVTDGCLNKNLVFILAIIYYPHVPLLSLTSVLLSDSSSQIIHFLFRCVLHLTKGVSSTLYLASEFLLRLHLSSMTSF